MQIKCSDVKLALCYGAGRNINDLLVQGSRKCGESPLLSKVNDAHHSLFLLSPHVSSKFFSTWSSRQQIPSSHYH